MAGSTLKDVLKFHTFVACQTNPIQSSQIIQSSLPTFFSQKCNTHCHNMGTEATSANVIFWPTAMVCCGMFRYVPAVIQLSGGLWELKFLAEQMAAPLCSSTTLMLFQGGVEFSSVIMHDQLPAHLSNSCSDMQQTNLYLFFPRFRHVWKAFVYLFIYFHGAGRTWILKKLTREKEWV